MSDEQIRIRKGKEEDVSAMLSLIKELALYEKAPEQVITSEKSMIKDGFGENPAYRSLVAETADGEVVAVAIYFQAYSTWRGRVLYLDDLVVREKYRSQGIGKLMFDRLIKEAEEMEVDQMRWVVLEWNEPAIRFYEKYKAELNPEWHLGFLRKEQITEWNERN